MGSHILKSSGLAPGQAEATYEGPTAREIYYPALMHIYLLTTCAGLVVRRHICIIGGNPSPVSCADALTRMGRAME